MKYCRERDREMNWPGGVYNGSLVFETVKSGWLARGRRQMRASGGWEVKEGKRDIIPRGLR